MNDLFAGLVSLKTRIRLLVCFFSTPITKAYLRELAKKPKRKWNCFSTKFTSRTRLINSAPAYMAATDIGLLLKSQTDVIILNSASIENAYQAVTTGKMIYAADHDVKGLNFDFKPFLECLRRGNNDVFHSDCQEYSV